jgi:photosystem II stability/assembly factor-like uncharacterized protein
MDLTLPQRSILAVLRPSAVLALLAAVSTGCFPGSGGDGPVQARFHPIPAPATKGPAIDPSDVAMISPRTGFLTTGRGLLQRTRDGGTTWTTVWSRRGASLDAIVFADRRHGIAVGSLANRAILLRTTDGGRRWRLEHPRLGPYAFAGLELRLLDSEFGYTVVDPASFMSAPALRTSDGGRTWRRARFPGDADFVSRSVGYAVGYRSRGDCSTIWKTTDGGRSWRLLRCLRIPLHALEFVNERQGFAAGGHSLEAERGPSQVVLRTTDGGQTWQRVYVDPRGGYRHGVSPLVWLHFNDAKHGWARTGACKCCPSAPCSGEVMTTANGGRTWRRNGWAVQLAPGGVRSALVVPTCDETCGVVWRTRDGARTWEPLAGPAGLNFSRVEASGRELYLETFDSAHFLSSDGGKSWRFLRDLSDRDDPPWDKALALRNGLLAVGTYHPELDISRDVGRTFRRVRLGGDGARQVFALAFADTERGLAVTGDYGRACRDEYGGTHVFSTRDGGGSWRRLPDSPFAISALGYVPGLAVAAGQEPGCRPAFAVSRDEGRTWATTRLREPCSVSVAPPRSIWVYCPNLLRLSDDGGDDWRDVRGRFGWSSLAALDDREAWATRDGRLWHTNDRGVSWIQVWPDLPTP